MSIKDFTMTPETTGAAELPEAIRIADALDLYAIGDEHQRDIENAAAELRRLHARIAELEAQLASIGAGGVSGPMMGQPQAMPDLSALTERGAKAWAGVDAQGLRDGVASAGSEPVAPDFYTACALYEEGGEAGWIPLPGYSNETEHGVKHLVLEAARKEGYKGTAAGRLLELGWEIRPVYLTPQPTQTQAGAVPLTDREIELIDGMIQVQLDHASRCDAIANRSMADKQKGWDMERITLLQKIKAHGITKGGQHGAE